MRRRRHVLAMHCWLGVCLAGCQVDRPVTDFDHHVTQSLGEELATVLIQGPVRLLSLQGDRADNWAGTGRLTVTDQDQQSVTMDAVLIIEGNTRARLRTWKLGRAMMDVLYADRQAVGIHDRRVPSEGLIELAQAMPLLTAMLNQSISLDERVTRISEMPVQACGASQSPSQAKLSGVLTTSDGQMHFKRLLLTRNAKTLDFQWDHVEFMQSAPPDAWERPKGARIIAQGLNPLPLPTDAKPPAIEQVTIEPQGPGS